MNTITPIKFDKQQFALPDLTEYLGQQAIPCVDQQIITEKQSRNLDIIETLGSMLAKQGINPNAMSYKQFVDAITKDTAMREKVFESLLLNGDDFKDLETIEVLFK